MISVSREYLQSKSLSTYHQAAWKAAAGLCGQALPRLGSLHARRCRFHESLKKQNTIKPQSWTQHVYHTHAEWYLKQSSTDPTTSSASSFGSLPVTLPMLDQNRSRKVVFFSVSSFYFPGDIWIYHYPLAADQRTIVSLSFKPTSRCSAKNKVNFCSWTTERFFF